jgi:hypothetical protein
VAYEKTYKYNTIFLKFTNCFLLLVPGPVISPVAFSFGRKWIYLRWAPPYPPNGQVLKYKVEYKRQYLYSYTAKEVDVNKECDLWDGFVCFRLTDSHGIVEDKDYNIKVKLYCRYFHYT